MNYNKNETTKKQKKLVGKSSKNKRKVFTSFFKTALILILAICILGLGAGFGTVKGILDNAPNIDDIDVTPQGYQTTIYNQDGQVITTLSTINSNRVYAYYDDIPESMREAFIAIEDERFWEHNGIDMRGLLRAGFVGIKNKDFSQGASTITQQLIKNQVFNVGLDEDTFMDKVERKLQEQYLAIQLEERMSKEDILEYYLNTIYLGQGVHGVQAASTKYFNKELDELTISEVSVIAAITQNPSKYDPIVFPEKNAERRTRVLKKMKELEYISQAEYDTALADDVYARINTVHTEYVENKQVNSYFIDAVIKDLANRLIDELGYTETQAYNAIYSGGLSVYITQDQAIQDICDQVINDSDNYPGGTKVALAYQLTITDQDGENPINYSSNHLLKYYKELTGNSKYNLIYKDEDAARFAADTFRDAMLEETGGKVLAETYSTTVQPQASFVVMDQSTGQVKAITGGRGEKTGNLTLNRATDSPRQPGSTFKVLASFAPAIDTDIATLASGYDDAPYNYANGRPVSNWYSGYRGMNTIRTAIQESMNIIAVKCITDLTPDKGYEYLENLGFTTLVKERTDSNGNINSDINQSLALGGLTDGVTNFELTGAYACLANSGIYLEPILYTKVLDHNGNILIDNTPEPKQVFKSTTAWLINDAMQDVVTKGTGTPARLSSGMVVAGKTGTTSNNYDFWFCGSTPYYTAGIWMGYDINTKFDGGSYHKKMWSKIMNAIVELEGQDTSAKFPTCDGIVTATVCIKSGMIPAEGCTAVTEFFAKGSVPTKTCNAHKFIELCNDSHLLATEFCPNRTSYEFNVDSYGNLSISTIDFTLPDNFDTTHCNIHTTPEDTSTENPNTNTPQSVSFTITASVNGGGGTITGPLTVVQGGTATFTIVPNSGYAIASVVVDGEEKGPTSSHVFRNVNMNHTITVTFVQVTPNAEVTPEPPTETQLQQ